MLITEHIPSFTEIITPYLPLAGIVIGTVLVALFDRHNKRKGAIEHRAPDVNEIWAREERVQKDLDAEREKRRRMETLAGKIIKAFRAYVDRVRSGGSVEPTTGEQKILCIEITHDDGE